MKKYSDEKYSGASVRSTEEKIKELDSEIENMQNYKSEVEEITHELSSIKNF